MNKVTHYMDRVAIGAALILSAITIPAIAADDPELREISVPREISAGYIEPGYVRLDGPAGPDGVVVFLVNDQPGMVAHPTRIFIKPGDESGMFPIRASHNAKSRYVKIAASTGDDGVLDKMRIHAAPAQSRTLMQRNVPVKFRVRD